MQVVNSGTFALSSRAELATAVQTYTRGQVGKEQLRDLPHGGGSGYSGLNIWSIGERS